MFNLLPNQAKAEIVAEYKNRRFVSWCVGLMFLILILSVLLVPMYISLAARGRDLRADTTLLPQTNTDTLQALSSTNTLIATLKSNIPQSSTAAIIAHIITLSGSVSLTEFASQAQDATTSTMTIQGVAPNRESLLAFEKRLEADPRLANINLPVSDFAKDSNISFSLTLTAFATTTEQ